MKRTYFWTLPLAVISFMIGIHLLLGFTPVQDSYNEAVTKSEKIRATGTEAAANVITPYSYANTPNMGSPYGADVVYASPVDGYKEYAWVAFEERPEKHDQLTVLVSPEIKNFAVNADNELIPNEKPDVSIVKWILFFLLAPIAYLLFEVITAVTARIRGKERNYVKARLHVKPIVALAPAIILLLNGLGYTAGSLMSLAEYNAATQRIEAVRAQHVIIEVPLLERCNNTSKEDCDDRYKAIYHDKTSNYYRWVDIKGDIINDEGKPVNDQELKEVQIPFVLNDEDRRFGYSLSSNEQVKEPYNTIEFVAGPTMLVFLLFFAAVAIRQHREEKIEPARYTMTEELREYLKYPPYHPQNPNDPTYPQNPQSPYGKI